MLLRARVTENEYEIYKAYADEHCSGNMSSAVKELMSYGLASRNFGKNLQDLIEEYLNPRFEEIEIRIAKIVSRGTKASLGNLALDSTVGLTTVEMLEHISQNLELLLEAHHIDFDDEAAATALWPVRNLAHKQPASVFSWGWDAGGKLQAEKGRPDYSKATKGLKTEHKGADGGEEE